MIPITRKPIDGPAWTLRRGVPKKSAYDTVYLGKEQICSGSLILVNAAHPVRKFAPRLARVAEGILQAAGQEEPGIALDETCLAQLSALLDACEGKEQIAVVSGYRSKDKQKAIYLDTLRERGKAYTESYVALPGASEHQTGLAVDVGLTGRGLDYIAPSFPEHAGVSASFKRLAPAYGFIQRYEESKKPLTGIAGEPWHFRYVGFPHSAIMARENLCLEEYAAFLKRYAFGREHLIFGNEARTIGIYYVAALNGLTPVPVPVGGNAVWEVSGNNEDGFVVTAAYAKGTDRDGN